MVTDMDLQLTVEFTMHSPTDYLSIAQATKQLVARAGDLGITAELCSMSTSASDGYGSVSMMYRESFSKPADDV